MSAHVIDGRRYARDLHDSLTAEVSSLVAQGARPGLATIVAGDSYPAHAYERRVRRLAEELGVHYVREHLPRDVAEADAVSVVGKLDADPRVSGILILRPLPPQVSEAALYRALDPLKDIEAVHPVNVGLLTLGRPRFVPSTPAAAFHLLDRYLLESGQTPAAVYQSSNVVVVGRSANVGKPALTLAMERGATVLSCDVHSYSSGLLYRHTRIADILVVATGVPGLIHGDHVKDGVIAVDVGINPVVNPGTDQVRLVGDVDFPSVAAKARAITPVPGGVGPITDVWLLRNTVAAARLQLSVSTARPLLEGLSLLTPDSQLARAGTG
ncbi:bifunctional 5,10-methylenetetrahydrofolate dehydrogenase/5,10-methenyltetrahydrofolate cyclohydrolase [Streptomyces sp. NPDC001292]|uniref:bifunctional 5,10-methylenetetrahydrofolate dehydrogenase/5,10-methenyltetrahydrofolate cyclohydrolase n=1 Tax=Streptomyces sp. NPDC001292 TaxID=3364558 RepID=UPI0036BFB0C4